MARTRRRSNAFPKGIAQAFYKGNVISTTDYATDLEKSYSETTTENPWPTGWTAYKRLLADPEVPEKGKEQLRANDYGCYFLSEKTRVSTPIVRVNAPFSADIVYSYTGPIFADTGYKSHLVITPQSQDLLDANGEGAKSIKTTAPTKPEASLAVMAGELREGLPRLIGARLLKGSLRNLPRNSADEFLNYQFGWLPLVSDLQKLAHSVLNSRAILEQLYRDSGKTVRRRLPGKTNTVTTQAILPDRTISPGLVTAHYVGPTKGRLAVDVTENVTRWFSAQYAYTLPKDDTLMGRLALWESEARKVLGLSVSLETAWDLSPYSWLVDWGLDIGTVLSNITITGRDQFVIEHGYQMLHRVNNVDLTTLDVALKGYGPIKTNLVFDRKIRLRASPYGMDTDQDGLTAVQMAILGALGITQYPKDLSFSLNPKRR